MPPLYRQNQGCAAAVPVPWNSGWKEGESCRRNPMEVEQGLKSGSVNLRPIWVQ